MEESRTFPTDTAAQILGLVERDASGVLVQTKKGEELQNLLQGLPEEKRKEAAVTFLKEN